MPAILVGKQHQLLPFACAPATRNELLLLPLVLLCCVLVLLGSLPRVLLCWLLSHAHAYLLAVFTVYYSQRIPERIIEHAVKGMLPKGRLGRDIRLHLKVYKGTEHPHDAQQPINITSHISKKPKDVAALKQQ